MIRTKGIRPGDWCIDAFPGDRPNPPHEVMRVLPGESVSPEGYALFELRDSNGKTYTASAYDLVKVRAHAVAHRRRTERGST